MEPKNIKLRKFLTTVVLVIAGLALVRLGYWVGEPIGKQNLGIADFLIKSKLSAGLNAFGACFFWWPLWLICGHEKSEGNLRVC